MAKIGAISHLPELKSKKCKQCFGWFRYKRISKEFCSDACRQQNKRGVEPSYKNRWQLNEKEGLASIIASEHPEAFRILERMKAKYGFRAVQMTLEVIELLK